MNTKQTNNKILKLLWETYPDAHCALDFDSPLELLIATCLSAQTTDKQVNIVTKQLFMGRRNVADYEKLSLEEIKGYIHSLGFYNNKAENLYRLFRALEADFGGEVPRTMEELVKLPGVGRKTASVVLSNAFQIPAMPVDTHVFRVANRLGLADAENVEKTEQQLCALIPRDMWILSHHALIDHGRAICHARGPECDVCPMASLCAYHKGVK